MRHVTITAALLAVVASSTGVRAETYRFLPTTFYSTLSASHPAVLRIKSGDRVVTSTLDDTGAGADGKVVATASNPQTGPFFVEDALPGDLLVVTIEKLVPNRDTGFSTSTMIANSIDPGSITSRPDPKRYPWTIDLAAGKVRLDLYAVAANVDWKSRFATTAFELPLMPTLASIGTAPAAGTTVPASQPGPSGGNLFATDLAVGARVMLPVTQPGALLFLGRGLASRGDGSVTGTGIETSMDVEFSVEVVKKKEWPHSSVVRPSTVVGEFAQGWPRIETAEYLMTAGSAPSLLQALQHATIELHHWLDDDFGLSEKSVTLFVGQAIEYEITSIVEPSYTVVAKVRKAFLPKGAIVP